MPNKIKFIYFDVGGVVILDFSKTTKWQEMTSAFGVTPDIRNKFDERFVELEKEVCIGRDVETLIPIFQKEFGIKVPEDYSFLKNFVDRFERNESVWPLLEKIKENYKIGLLTNMYPRMFEMIKSQRLMPGIEWDVVIDSSVEGCQKPEDKIFVLAEQRANTGPSEILFVENTTRHLSAASAKGWQTLLYDPIDLQGSNDSLKEILS